MRQSIESAATQGAVATDQELIKDLRKAVSSHHQPQKPFPFL